VLGPLPKTACDLGRQAISQLAGEHDDLSAVMAFVRDEITEDVAYVEGKVAPYVRRCGRDASSLIAA